MKIKVFLPAFVVLTCSTSGWTAEPDECKQAQISQIDADMCSSKTSDAANAHMTSVYNQLFAAVGKTEGTARQTRLAAAQAAWRHFRDDECSFVSSAYEGGSVAPEVQNNCEARLTRMRIQRLESYISCETGKDPRCD